MSYTTIYFQVKTALLFVYFCPFCLFLVTSYMAYSAKENIFRIKSLGTKKSAARYVPMGEEGCVNLAISLVWPKERFLQTITQYPNKNKVIQRVWADAGRQSAFTEDNNRI